MPKLSAQKKGIALLVVLAMLVVITILANVVLNIMLSHSRLSHHQLSRIKAFYAAKAGMNLALEKLRTGDWGYGSSYAINCVSSVCTAQVPAANIVSDSDINYEVTISIEQQGVGGPNNTTQIKVETDYTYH